MEFKICKYCGMQISKQAVICPHCRRKQKNEKVKWIVIGIVCFVVIGGMASSLTNNDTSNTSSNQNNTVDVGSSDTTNVQPETKTTDTSNYIEITSSQLIDLYKDNQVKCKQLYDNQKLKVTGKVESIGTDVLNQTYVCLGHDNQYTFVGIQCYAKDAQTQSKIAELNKGDIITVAGIGECGSMSFDLKKAEIIG